MKKLTSVELDNLAEGWGEAYRADYCGREVSIEIIRASLDFGFTESEAKEVYFSKNIRWFFDSQGDKVKRKDAHKLFTQYLTGNLGHIRTMFKRELGKDLENI